MSRIVTRPQSIVGVHDVHVARRIVGYVARNRPEHTAHALDGLGVAATANSDPDVIGEFLYAPGMRVAGGTSEIQRNLIGERLLG